MTKICFINTNKAWGGGEKWHLSTAKTLLKNGYDVSMIINPNSALDKELNETKIKKFHFKIGKISFVCPFTHIKTKKFFQENQFDTVIMNLPSDVKAFSKAASSAGVKNIIYRRGMNHPIKPSLINSYIYKKFVTDIIANSEDVKESICRFIPELSFKTKVIYNGIDTDQIKKVKEPFNSEVLIGNLGRLVDQKGQHYLIELGKILKDKNIPYKIYIAGDGPLKEKLREQIYDSRQEKNIFLLGMTTAEELFSKIDYFVFTSKFEGLSNAMLESLQYRKPIICFDTASNKEIIMNNINGILVPPFEVSKMAEEIYKLYQDPARFKNFQQQGKKTLIEKFDQEKMIQKLEELIQK